MSWMNNFLKYWEKSYRVFTEAIKKLLKDYSLLVQRLICSIRLKSSEYADKQSIQLIFGNIVFIPLDFDRAKNYSYHPFLSIKQKGKIISSLQ